MDAPLSKGTPFGHFSPLQTGTIRQRLADDKILQATDGTATEGTETVDVGVVRVFALGDGGLEQLTLIHTPDRDASQNSTLSKKRRPRFASKKKRRHRKSTQKRAAADKLEFKEQHKIMNDIIFRNEPGILCLPCCAEAYEEEMVIGFDKTKSGGKGVLGRAPVTKRGKEDWRQGGSWLCPPVNRSGQLRRRGFFAGPSYGRNPRWPGITRTS